MKRRIIFAGIPIDYVDDEVLELVIQELVSQKMNHQIVLLDFPDFMRARRNADYRALLNSASLVIPVSRTLQRGYRYIRKEDLPVYMAFDFVIRLLGILEKHGWSAYLFSSKPGDLARAAGNLRASFPGLKIIGRHAGYYPAELEEDIILAIRKASPTLLLTGKGVPMKDRWIRKNSNRFNPGLYLWCRDCFDIFCGNKARPGRRKWERGLDSFQEAPLKPWRYARIFLYIYYWIMMTVYKIRKR